MSAGVPTQTMLELRAEKTAADARRFRAQASRAKLELERRMLEVLDKDKTVAFWIDTLDIAHKWATRLPAKLVRSLKDAPSELQARLILADKIGKELDRLSEASGPEREHRLSK